MTQLVATFSDLGSEMWPLPRGEEGIWGGRMEGAVLRVVVLLWGHRRRLYLQES